MKNKKLIYPIGGLTILFFISVLFIIRKYENYLNIVNDYFKSTDNFQQYVIQNTAIYEDYKNSEIEKELRTYLLLDHLKVARDLKYVPITNQKDIEKLAIEGSLKFIETGLNHSYYFYNVPPEFRYLRDFTQKGLILISNRFAENLFAKPTQSAEKEQKNLAEKFKVKLAISSAIRPTEYQKNLRDRNGNASAESTHSYGISFDIFYDDFFVSTIDQAKSEKKSFKSTDLEKIRRKHGFALGRALRRQFQTVLSKTLIELQREKKLYAILETNQRCYHVTILP